MSNYETDRDGFRIVKSKKSSKNRQTKIPLKSEHFEKEETKFDIDKIYCRIKLAVEELQLSQYVEYFNKSVSTIIKDRKVIEIICFGLGHIAECNISKYQLAFLLYLQTKCECSRVLVHDPIFYKDECELLKRLGLEVISENNEGSYIISDKHTTVAYFPHCPKQLTNNFLWCNWSIKLHNCLLICNSFSALIDNNPNRILVKTVPYIYKINQYTNEIVIENHFKFTDIFNDTSLHYFDKKILENVEAEFWDKTEKPVYDNTEEFITSRMIESLNI